MNLTSNSKITLSLSAFGAIILGIIAILSYVKADTPIASKESSATPSIQNIQNNNNFSNTSSSTSSQEYQDKAPISTSNNTRLEYKNTQLEGQNAQLKNDIAELLAKNTAWQKYSDQQSQEISRLKKIIDDRQETHSAIEKLNKENKEYFSKIQTTGGFNAFEPTAEQKIDYRNAIAQNIEMIKGYQGQLKTLSN